MKKTEKMWAVVGCCGLYTGTWLTRKDAIRFHSVTKRLGIGDEWSKGTVKKAWKDCKKSGDRVVKVEVSYER